MNDSLDQVNIDGLRLECKFWAAPAPAAQTIVLLHEGLGSLELWRDFPDRLCAATGCNILTYSRLGHGRSDQPATARNQRYLHQEAQQVLPRVIKHFDLTLPILFGHSDGASIALLYAAAFPPAVSAIVVAAPHLFVEEITLAGIRLADDRFASGLEQRLSRYHNDAAALFFAWRDIWLSEPFLQWNIEAAVKDVRCPILAIQGEADQYGTLAQIERIKELAGQTELLVLPGCGHAPHQEKTEVVLERVAEFLAKNSSSC